jgi:arylsulfatase A-like enzyme
MTGGPRSLVLITVDCLRADHVGFLGYNRPTTPFLDSISRESIVAQNAIVAGSPTYYSFPAILASRFPLALGRDIVGIAPDEVTLPSILKDAGFRTAGFVAGNPYLSREFGYDQGFDVFKDFLGSDNLGGISADGDAADLSPLGRANQVLRWCSHAWRPSASVYDELYFRYCQRVSIRTEQSFDSLSRFPSADVIVDHAISWLNENKGGAFFLWLHFMDPHAPYYPKQQSLEEIGNVHIDARRARFLNSYWTREDLGSRRLQKKRDEVIALYDAGIRWVDSQVRRLAETLVEMNVWNQCTVAVTADHGEEFLEHQGRFHAPVKLTEELIRVPLLLRSPGLGPGVATQPFSLIDLAPTMLEGLGIPCAPDFRGRSRWNEVSKHETWNRPVLTECIDGCTNPYRKQARLGARILAVRRGPFKLVVNFSSGAEHLYDLERDPGEHCPLPPAAEKTVRRGLLQYARQHVAESHQSRDFNRRFDSKLRDLRLELAHSRAITTN